MEKEARLGCAYNAIMGCDPGNLELLSTFTLTFQVSFSVDRSGFKTSYQVQGVRRRTDLRKSAATIGGREYFAVAAGLNQKTIL